MTTRVKVSPLRIRDRESKPVDDWVDIERIRIHNRPRPWSRPPPICKGILWSKYGSVGKSLRSPTR